MDSKAIDGKILDLLERNARMTATSIAKQVSLSPAAVRRRIARLERAGVIVGYALVRDHNKEGGHLEAYLELTFDSGQRDPERKLDRVLRDNPEVREASLVTGEPDAVLRLRVRSREHLKETVIKLRNDLGHVTTSKTLLALSRQRQIAESLERPDENFSD